MFYDSPLDFTMKEGTNRTLVLYIREQDDLTGDITVVDVTGWTFYFDLRVSRTASTSYITKDSTDTAEIEITAPTNGEIKIYLKWEDFSTSPRFNVPYYCEVFGVTPGGQRFDIGDGNPRFLRKVVQIP